MSRRIVLSWFVLPWFVMFLFGPLVTSCLASEDPLLEPGAVPSGEVRLANRYVVTLRAQLMGETPAVRVLRAEKVIGDLLHDGENLLVSVDPLHDSRLVMISGHRALIITPGDLGPDDESVALVAERTAENLRQVIQATEQSRNLRYMLRAGGYTVAATLLLLLAIRLVRWARQRMLALLLPFMRQKTSKLKVENAYIIDTSLVFPILRRCISLLCWLLILLCLYEWLGFVLRQFPYTRPWGDGLNSYLSALLDYCLEATVNALPGLALVVIIFGIAKGCVALLRTLLMRLAIPGTIPWLTNETLAPTNRLISLAIWLFALAMAYPYLPGAETEAFKGLSVLVGLMVSLGASNVVGQAAAGLILTYSGTIKRGEYVKVGDNEGTVIEMGIFTTRIMTGLGETLTIPNTLITSSVTRNYSRIIQGSGYIVDTTVTIGYDTPWRQVEALLLEACRRTEGILREPEPKVFQVSLSDFYPEYRLVAQAVPSEPRSRAQLMSMLLANIQDVFNEYGVQIMSPHYITDPADAKLVAKANWYAAPAQAPQTGQPTPPPPEA